MSTLRRSFIIVVLALAGGAQLVAAQAAAGNTSVAAARRFLDAAERELTIKNVAASRAGWISENFITHDTELLAADALADFAATLKRLVERARRFDRTAMPPELRRRFLLLKLQLAAPAAPGLHAGLRDGAARRRTERRLRQGPVLQAGRRREAGVPQPGGALALARRIAQPRFAARCLDGWQAIGVPMRDRYARFVTLANAGARHMGFADAGAMWRAGYDMPPDSFVAVVDKLWQEVRPLYVQLHAYVRRRLVTRYGPTLVPPSGMLPVHLLGNMWGQNWSNITDVALPAVAPGSNSGSI